MSFRILGEPFKTLGGGLRGGVLGGGSGGPSAVQFLFRDDFLTDEAAPIASPRTAEPGPGIGTVTQIDGDFDIAGGGLNANTLGGTAFGELGYSDIGRGRLAGLASYYKNLSSLTAGLQLMLGWNDASPPATVVSGLFFVGDIRARIGAASLSLETYNTGDVFEIFIIQRTSGFWVLIKGEQFDDWTIMWIDDSVVTATQFASITTRNMNFTLDGLFVSQLAAPWNTEFGIATDHLPGSRSASDTYTHIADFIGEFICTTVPAAGTIFWTFRRQDANNYWEVIIEPNQDITLREVVATVPTARGTSAAVVNNGDRIVVIADDETIRVYVENVLQITYALAANFKFETDGELLGIGNGAVDDIVTWPRIITGEARTALDRVANA